MLATCHMAAGAAVGKTVGRPWLALAAAFASHFLLDLIPHSDSHTLFGAAGGGPTPPEAAAALLDTLVGVLLVTWAVRRHKQWKVMLGAAFLAVVIDLVDNVPPWGTWFRAWPGTSWLSVFHHHFQTNVGGDWLPLGLGTQIALVAVALWLIRPGKGSK